MKSARVIKNLDDGSYVGGYTAQKTDGTKWAQHHVQRTYKRTLPDGSRAMLIPPPIQLRDFVYNEVYRDWTVPATTIGVSVFLSITEKELGITL